MGFQIGLGGIFTVISQHYQTPGMTGEIPEAEQRFLTETQGIDDPRQQVHLLVGLVQGISGRVHPAAGEHVGGPDPRDPVLLLPGMKRIALTCRHYALGKVVAEGCRGPLAALVPEHGRCADRHRLGLP